MAGNQPQTDRRKPWLAPRGEYAQSLDQLRERLGTLGEAAVAEARWGALSLAMMWAPIGPYPSEVANEAVMLCRAHDRARLDYPDARPGFVPADPLASMQSAERTRIIETGKALLEAWDSGGSPRLTAARIMRVHQEALLFRHRQLKAADAA